MSVAAAPTVSILESPSAVSTAGATRPEETQVQALSILRAATAVAQDSKAEALNEAVSQEDGVHRDGRLKLPRPTQPVACPRCGSKETKFCYYNNHNAKQPRYFCKSCQRYWTAGGTLRNVPVGAGKRKRKFGSREEEPAASGATQPSPVGTLGLPALNLQPHQPALGQPAPSGIPAATATLTGSNQATSSTGALHHSFLFSSLGRPPFSTSPFGSPALWPNNRLQQQADAVHTESFLRPDESEPTLAAQATAAPATAVPDSQISMLLALGGNHSQHRQEQSAQPLLAPEPQPSHELAQPQAVTPALSSYHANGSAFAAPALSQPQSDWAASALNPQLQLQPQAGANMLGQTAIAPSPLAQSLHPTPTAAGNGSQGFQPFSSFASMPSSGAFLSGKALAKPGGQEWISMAGAASHQQVAAQQAAAYHLQMQHMQQIQMQQAAAMQLQMQAAAAANWSQAPPKGYMTSMWPMSMGMHSYSYPWAASGFHQVGSGLATPNAMLPSGDGPSGQGMPVLGSLALGHWGGAAAAAQHPAGSLLSAATTPSRGLAGDGGMPGDSLAGTTLHHAAYISGNADGSDDPSAASFAAYPAGHGSALGHLQGMQNSMPPSFSASHLPGSGVPGLAGSWQNTVHNGLDVAGAYRGMTSAMNQPAQQPGLHNDLLGQQRQGLGGADLGLSMARMASGVASPLQH